MGHRRLGGQAGGGRRRRQQQPEVRALRHLGGVVYHSPTSAGAVFLNPKPTSFFGVGGAGGTHAWGRRPGQRCKLCAMQCQLAAPLPVLGRASVSCAGVLPCSTFRKGRRPLQGIADGAQHDGRRAGPPAGRGLELGRAGEPGGSAGSLRCLQTGLDQFRSALALPRDRQELVCCPAAAAAAAAAACHRLCTLPEADLPLTLQAATELLVAECSSAQPSLQQALAVLLDADLKQVLVSVLLLASLWLGCCRRFARWAALQGPHAACSSQNACARLHAGGSTVLA